MIPWAMGVGNAGQLAMEYPVPLKSCSADESKMGTHMNQVLDTCKDQRNRLDDPSAQRLCYETVVDILGEYGHHLRCRMAIFFCLLPPSQCRLGPLCLPEISKACSLQRGCLFLLWPELF